jgi:hypothetical protein
MGYSTATCVIEDTDLGRRITASKNGSLSTAVWNSGPHAANKIGVDYFVSENNLYRNSDFFKKILFVL